MLPHTTASVNITQDDILALARQLVLQQLYMEEQTRSAGDSGIKQIRYTHEGSRPYHSPSHAGKSFAAIHDHANNICTIGMGETTVVLNGVEFRTRHNDYGLKMPSSSTHYYHASQFIDFPPVPPSVLEQDTVKGQLKEMRQWFGAWQSQNHTVRDYRKYFKPVLCYLEGAWIKAPEEVEDFPSDRHYIDAKYWKDLEERIRFLSYSGGKHSEENFAYLPKVLINVSSERGLEFAQWTYRIMCHPLKTDLPLNRFRVVDDLKSRLISGLTLEEYAQTRAARFTLNPIDSDDFFEGQHNTDLLEDLMREIPGKDNYGGNLQDVGYLGLAYDPVSKGPLNTAFYHRKYFVRNKDASGHFLQRRGFSDQNLFMATTSHKKVIGMDFEKCVKPNGICGKSTQRWTYAIPLEIVYLTPLSNWNPFNIEYKGHATSRKGKTVSENGGNGSLKKPYNGTNNKRFFQTPSWFFSGSEVDPDPADTSRPSGDITYVLDRKGKTRKMVASGHRVFLPNIPGLGVLRQRYPIAPVHGEGSAVWKELEALKDVILRPKSNCHMFYDNSCRKHH